MLYLKKIMKVSLSFLSLGIRKEKGGDNVSVKRVHSAFSKALQRRGYSFENNVAESPDGSVKVEFGGSAWTVSVDGKFVLEHPMEGGSMATLEQVLKREGKPMSSSESGAAVKRAKNKGKPDRVEVRKSNKVKGDDKTADQKVLEEFRKGEQAVSTGVVNAFTQKLLLEGFKSVAVSPELEFELDDCKVAVSSKGDWRCFISNTLCGEGICSAQSVDVIKGILDNARGGDG
jgi:hypothetical protein